MQQFVDLRNSMKLTAKQKKGIRTWLKMVEEDKPDYCPFLFPTDIRECLYICPELFPRLKRREKKKYAGGWCPCNTYTLAHVIRTARKAVEK